jgi:hypothetical protein
VTLPMSMQQSLWDVVVTYLNVNAKTKKKRENNID